MSKKKFFILTSLIIAVGLIADQVTKAVFENLLAGNKTINILGDWLTLHFTKNWGGAFGSLSGNNILFFIVTLLGLPMFAVMMWKSKHNTTTVVGLSLALSGAVGNAIDRAVFAEGFFDGYVRDFISVRGFAIFNVADMLLCVGVGLVILSMLFLDRDAIFKFKKQPEVKSGE